MVNVSGGFSSVLMARTLVIGGCGFLGSHIVDALLAKGHEVRIVDLQPIPRELAVPWRDVAYVRGDMLGTNLLAQVTQGCDYVFQYATTTIPRTSIADPELDNQNLIASLRLIRACASAKVEKIVFPSSGGTVYGAPDRLPVSEDAPLRPRSPYAATKIAIEYQLGVAHRLHGMDYAVLRYGNPYGPRQSPVGDMGVVSVFFGLLRRGIPPTLYGDGTAMKDFFFVDDAAAAAIAVLRPADEKTFNVASGEGTRLRDLLERMGKTVGRTIEPKRAPPLPGDEPACVLDIGRIRRVYGWAPRVSLEDGLRRTWNWIQSLPA
jgi:UDP-glucose 4-epimerase